MSLVKSPDGFVYHDNRGDDKWKWRDWGWQRCKSCDDYWITLGLSNGRGIGGTLKKLLSHKAFSFVSNIALKIADTVSFGASSIIANFASSAIKNGLGAVKQALPDIMNRLAVELPSNDFIGMLESPIMVEQTSQNEITDNYNRLVKYDPSDNWKSYFMFKRLLQWAYENHGIITKADYSNEAGKRTATVIIALRLNYDNRNDMSLLRDAPKGAFLWASNDFGQMAKWITKYHRDGDVAVKRFNEIGRAISIFKITSDEKEVADHYENLQSNAATGNAINEQIKQKSVVPVVVGAAAAGATLL